MITPDEVFLCCKVIYNILSLESKLEPLHPMNTGQRGKGLKREEQYKAVWNELETLIKNNVHSENHKNVYDCLKDSHNFDEEISVAEKTEGDEQFAAKAEQKVQRASVIRATTDSPMSPPPLTTITPMLSRGNRNSNGNVYGNGPKSLLDIFSSQQEKGKSRAEFEGRSGDSLVAKLYPNLKVDDRGPREQMEVE